ncbi:MAG: GTPase Era [Chloroflexi bacterium]|nr:GTPase Era [Chloroflexota bacterium]
MTETETAHPFKSGFVAVLGRPNAGKSTLMNTLMGQAIAGVSAKPQTTRRRQLGILTSETAQIILVDTPGLHESKDKLSLAINSEAIIAIQDADIILYMADANSAPSSMDEKLVDLIANMNPDAKVILVMNKVDSVAAQILASNQADYQALFTEMPEMLQISALRAQGVHELLEVIQAALPEGPQYYDAEQITDDFERDIAAEMIRAAAMDNLSQELPYSIAVLVNEYSERDMDRVYINATIFVEREAQKGIVIGKGGQKIKQIGTDARRDIEEMNGQSVFLDLNVKVKKDWKDDERFLRQLGLNDKK